MILVVILLFLTADLGSAISSSAQRVEGRFVFVPYPGNVMPPSDSSLSPPCPTSIAFSKIETYRGINIDQPESEYDGILWDDLLIDDTACQGSPYATTSTYFTETDLSPPATPPDSANPWFLTGFDNSPLRCPTYSPLYPARYFFTDDLPRFRDQLIRSGLLAADRTVRPIRGDIYLFVVFLSEDGQIMDPNICLFIADLLTDTSSEVESSEEPAEDTGPACLSARMPLRVPYHSNSRPSYNRFVSDFQPGDLVSYPYFPSSQKRLQDAPHDIVVSFSHHERRRHTRFLSISLRISGNNSRNLELSPGHLLYLVDQSLVRAADVVVGDRLLSTENGPFGVLVVRISEVTRRGVYAPITKSGRLLVHGVVISCYTDAIGNVAAHALLTPVRAVFLIYAFEWCDIIDTLRLIVFEGQIPFGRCAICAKIAITVRTLLRFGS